MSGNIKFLKKYDFWKWTLSIICLLLTLVTPFIDVDNGEFKIDGGYLKFLIIFISTSLTVVLWIISWIKQLSDLKSKISTDIDSFSNENKSLHSSLEDVTSLVTAAKELNKNISNVTQKVNELAIWRKNEQEDKINITVSDLDDYLILLPLHLSMRYLKGLDVKIETRSCGSDKKAIEELITGNSNFAITDPYYLKDYPNSDLVLLSPLITKTPMWWMSKKKSGGEISRIFSYETINEQDTHDTYTSRLLKEQINKLGLEGKYTIVTIKEVVEELCKELDNEIKLNRREETLISSYKGQNGQKGIEGLKEDADRITAFECLLFSCVETSDLGKKIRGITTKYFQNFNYFLVTEPDCSFIRDVLEYTAEPIDINNDSFFTGIITTRKYMHEFPVASLKMLRGLRDGILMSNIILMREDTKSIKKAFEEALIAVSKDQKAQLFKMALESIKKFELNATFFPNDLVILDTDNSYVEKDDKYYISMINKYKKSDYGDSILRTKVTKGKPADLKDPDIKFIIEGLGYEC